MTLWETVWSQVRAEMPEQPSRPRSWGGFFGALIAGLVIIAIWFPIRLVAELLKTIDFSERPNHTSEAQELFRQAYTLSRDLPSKNDFATSVLRHVDLPCSLHEKFFEALRSLYAENMMLEVPGIPVDLENLDGIRWRDRMRREIARMKSDVLPKMRRACLSSIEAATAGLPKIVSDGEIVSPLGSLVSPGKFVEALVRPLDAELFPHFADRYEENTYRASGVVRTKHTKPPKLVQPHHLDDPSPFLAGTPFDGILATPLGTEIPQSVRSSHHWIVAGTGAGKTNALEYLIAKDIERAIRGECSIVVIDSQHQLIDKLWSLKLFAPGQPLDGKLCLLDAADVEYPIAFNLFDMKLDAANSLSPLDREKLFNSALEMYDFIIGSLLQSEMTSRQSTLFRFVTRAMFAIPDATIHTFHDILQNGPGKYQSFIDTLDHTARQFFATDFNNAQFRQTKEQVIARLWAVLGNQTFLRMFSSPRSKFDLFAEINKPGKVILINAEKGLLKEEGTELFGRFFLALINQAAAQRSSLPIDQRMPCYVYVDECHQLHPQRSEDPDHSGRKPPTEYRRHSLPPRPRPNRTARAARAQRQHRYQDGSPPGRRGSYRDGAGHEYDPRLYPGSKAMVFCGLRPRYNSLCNFHAFSFSAAGTLRINDRGGTDHRETKQSSGLREPCRHSINPPPGRTGTAGRKSFVQTATARPRRILT